MISCKDRITNFHALKDDECVNHDENKDNSTWKHRRKKGKIICESK